MNPVNLQSSKELLLRWSVAVLTIGITLASSAGVGAASHAAIAAPIRLTAIHMVDASVGWGQNARAVFRTTNGGHFWTDLSPGAIRRAAMAGAFFLSGTDAWLAVTTSSDLYNGRITVYRTTDGGLHWAASTVPATGYASPSFANGRDGWLFVSKGPGAGQNPYILLRTVDGGAHWRIVAQSTPQQSPGSFPGCDCTFAVTFRDRRTGWSTGTQFALQLPDWLWVSHNGGHTWQHQSLPIPRGLTVTQTDAPVFSGQQNGAFLAQLVGGPRSIVFALYLTYDGGVTWRRGALLSTRQGGAISSSVADPEHAWVSDGRRLYRTGDGGQHWTSIYPQVPAFARGFWTNGRITAASPDSTIDFVSATTGFAIDAQGHAGRRYILQTTNGGLTWRAIYPLSGSLPIHG
jgi:photosystem II stability/assembly factor-like uncharacterized protein